MTENQPSLFRYRVKLLALIGVFLVPFIGGWLALYVFDVRPEATNYGTLVQPVKKVSWGNILTQDSVQLEQELARRWAFVLFARGGCKEECQQALYLMRQIRSLLARDHDRLRNVLVLSGKVDESLKTYLVDYPGVIVIENMSKTNLTDQFSMNRQKPLGSYLVDPDKNLMMVYPENFDEYRVLEDLKKLMKLSQIG
ncbi:MAG: hypothetical protein ACI8XC_000317 [Gammaproteobacteria bacterium]|jgi:hypothetical protein